MCFNSVEPVRFQQEYFREQRSKKFQEEERCSQKNQKILRLVLQKMDLLEEESSGLLASACAPQVVLQNLFRKQQSSQREKFERAKPIGIYANSHFNWLNVCLQFIIFLPSVREWLYFLPKCFNPFKDFVEKYVQSLKQGIKIIESLPYSDLKWLDEKKDFSCPILNFFNFLQENIPTPLYIPLFLDQSFDDQVLDDEFFMHGSSMSLDPKCLYTFQGQFYELTSFIELRVDQEKSISYLAYLKIDGKWFQCDDHRVYLFMGKNLGLVLKRGVFFHYKKIQFSFRNIIK